MSETTQQPATAGTVEPTDRHGARVLVHGYVSQRLDEVADLCEHWKRWRETRSHTPQAVRAALVMLAREVVMLAEMEQKHGPCTEPVGRT